MQELLKQADEMVKNPPERIHYAIKMILDLADKLRTTNDLDTQKEGHLSNKGFCKCKLPKLHGNICKQCNTPIETPSGD